MISKEEHEFMGVWVPKGTKSDLRLLAAEQGFSGLSELIRECIDKYRNEIKNESRCSSDRNRGQ